MGSKNYRLLIFLGLIAFVWNGCKPDEDVVPDTFTGAKVLIANQGNFGWGEGTLSVYYEESKTVDGEVYKAKNQESLGNVFHSIASFNGLYFFVINNSGKIVVTDSSYGKIKEITGLTSPRNIYKVTEDKAYITDLYSGAIYILDLNSLEVTGTIPCNGHTEEGIFREGLFWFAAPETANIYAVDVVTDRITDSLTVGWMPERMVLDNEKILWVLNRGDESKNESAKLTSVSITDLDITTTAFELSAVPASLAYDSKSNVVYFLSDGIWRLRLGQDEVPQSWMQVPDAEFYDVAVHPASGDVYVSDVKDFVSKSTIYRYSQGGTLLDEFSAGIIAGDFFFP